ncbi:MULTISPECIES: 2'-5' RNA ligase family protein [unclassified Streptomyces]|uniref:2'-5' RNA ligase family protein n=1 Tax=unclassified Streptomyces TaxID=2593676 RepID=UPI000DBA62BB|nr:MULTISPECIES: 2'-5' RNA ligase family protein [unclassified Streptomyces]MYT71870.1 2'-5' RNA ligase family protein [Streptomyces sp. SID8367]RAJ75250.1 2'-5' RNA ligase [Streptomyces sp. PsTaAH-137]
MHTVELLPDDATDEVVREAWAALAAAGAPSQAGHPHPTNRPHLTLFTLPALPSGLRLALGDALSAALPLPLRISGPHVFSGRTGTLAWLVAADPALVELRVRLRGLAEDVLGPWCVGSHERRPEDWCPHVTLGRSRRAAAWSTPGSVGFQVLPDPPKAGLWTRARTYDSASRTTEPLAP